MDILRLNISGEVYIMAKSSKPGLHPSLGVVEVKAWGCRCRCGHLWVPRDWLVKLAEADGILDTPADSDRPRVCPECKSANWDRPKRFERKTKGG